MIGGIQCAWCITNPGRPYNPERRKSMLTKRREFILDRIKDLQDKLSLIDYELTT
jgi:hypothetical protein